MKIVSLFVCFFIGFQAITSPNYETIISNLEKQVNVVNQNNASLVSKKCQDVFLEIENANKHIDMQMSAEIKKKKVLKKKYLQKKNLYALKKQEFESNLILFQKKNSLVLPYITEKELAAVKKEYEQINKEYLQNEKRIHRYQKKRALYDSYLKRMEACQNILFNRFFKDIEFLNQGKHDTDALIPGSYNLPGYGGYEVLENNGLSCLIDGNYAIDTTSSFWQNPIENGTISAGCWSYPNGGLHLGLDIASPMYSDVKAVANGIILYANNPVDSNNGYLENWCGWPSGGGNTICMVVSVNEKLYGISYAHLSNEIYVSSGQQVFQGTVLAHSGNSGNSTGPHTHVEVFELKQDLNSIIDYFRNSGADFSFGCGFNKPATCSDYACRIDPESVMEGI